LLEFEDDASQIKALPCVCVFNIYFAFARGNFTPGLRGTIVNIPRFGVGKGGD